MNINDLTNIGGAEWIGDSAHRIYFNNLEELAGLRVTTYGAGNVSSARMDGEKISNRRAQRLVSDLNHGKFYYDVNADQFRFEGMEQEIATKIKHEILRRITD